MEQNLFRGDDGSALRFFTQAAKNNFQSEKHGRMIFDTELCVEVITPGSTESQPIFVCERVFCEEAGLPPKRTPYYQRFAKQVESYKEQTGDYNLGGTPIAAWPQVDVGTAATLRAAGVHTVEMLAQVNDSALHALGIGGRTLRDKAQVWVQSREFGVPTAQVGAEVASLREENARLTAENASLRAALAAASSAPPEAPPADVPEFADLAGAETVSEPSAPPAPIDPFAALAGTPQPPTAPLI